MAEHAGARPAAATRIVLIDGRSGSGKSTLAERLVEALGGAAAGVDLVRMDDLVPGWRGLAEGSATASASIVAPLARGELARWTRWDWTAGGPDGDGDWGEELHREPGGTLVLEGCGSLTRASAPLAARSVWIEAPEDARHARARRRDGDDSWWEGWREQEDALYSLEGSRSLADLVLDGTLPDERLAAVVAASLEG